jgi:hypothetical protein
MPSSIVSLNQIITGFYFRTPQTTARTVQGTGAEVSKETNKNVAKDLDASLTSRATAAKDAAIDKKDEKSHHAKADVHKGNLSYCVSFLRGMDMLTMY